MKAGTLTMCVVCLSLTGCNDKSKVTAEPAKEPEGVEDQTKVESVLKEYEWDEARRLGQSYLRSAQDQYHKGYVKQAAETLQKIRKYVDYLSAKDLQELNALMDKIQTPVAKAPEEAIEKAPQKALEQPEQAETPAEQAQIDQDKERLEERETIVDLLITLNANVESLTCLATEIRDCLQSIEASQQVLIDTQSTP